MRPTTRRALHAAHTAGPALEAAARGPKHLLQCLLELAVATGRRMRIAYVNKAGETSERTIEPFQLGRNKKTGVPYVRAYDRLRGEHRTFTLPNITDYAEAA